MNKRWNALALAAAATLTIAAGPAAAQSQDSGDWIVRGRVLHLDSADKDSTGLDLSLKNKTFPEVDITYFFTPNIAAELVLTVPQKQRVTVQQSALGGPTDIGSFKHLPPTLMLQYHFRPDATVRPYVGAGINYTRLSGVNLVVPTVGRLDLERNSWGLAVGGGVDIALAKNWFLNFDVKKVQIRSDVKLGAQKVSQVKVDPWLFGVGVGYRF